MQIPMFIPKPAILFFPFMDMLTQKYGFDYYDYGGSHSIEARKFKQGLVSQWLEENGYSGKSYVLNKPEGSSTDWPKDSEEMLLRIEINTKMRSDSIEKVVKEKFPYLNFWHYVTDDCDVGGSFFYLNLDIDHDQEWVAEIKNMIKEEVKDNEAYDSEENMVYFYYDY